MGRIDPWQRPPVQRKHSPPSLRMAMPANRFQYDADAEMLRLAEPQCGRSTLPSLAPPPPDRQSPLPPRESWQAQNPPSSLTPPWSDRPPPRWGDRCLGGEGSRGWTLCGARSWAAPGCQASRIRAPSARRQPGRVAALTFARGSVLQGADASQGSFHSGGRRSGPFTYFQGANQFCTLGRIPLPLTGQDRGAAPLVINLVVHAPVAVVHAPPPSRSA